MANDPTPAELDQLAKRLVARAFAEHRPDSRKALMWCSVTGVLTGIASALLVMSSLAGHALAFTPLAIEIGSSIGAVVCLARYRAVRQRLHDQVRTRASQYLKPEETS